jgi:hypothetical protein
MITESESLLERVSFGITSKDSERIMTTVPKGLECFQVWQRCLNA